MTFKDFWKSKPYEETFEKAQKLSRDELTRIRHIIKDKTARGWNATRIKAYIEREMGIDEYRASRVYDTEVKRNDVAATRELGKDVGFHHYKVILSPNACHVCREKTANGSRIFSATQVSKTGYGQFVPWHPNCFCITVPVD